MATAAHGGLCSPKVSLGELIDLILAHVAEDARDDEAPSEGLLQEVTGLDRLSLRALVLQSFGRSRAILQADAPRRRQSTADYVARAMRIQGRTKDEIAAWLAEHGLPQPGETTTGPPSSSPDGREPADTGSGSPMGGGSRSQTARSPGSDPKTLDLLEWLQSVKGCVGPFEPPHSGWIVMIPKDQHREEWRIVGDTPAGAISAAMAAYQAWRGASGPIPEPTEAP